MSNMLTTIAAAKHRVSFIFAAVALIFLCVWTWPWSGSSDATNYPLPPPSSLTTRPEYIDVTGAITDYFEAYPLQTSDFGQMGKRMRVMKDWLEILDTDTNLKDAQKTVLQTDIERVAVSLIPFLHKPQSDSKHPLQQLRSSFVPGSKGLVITTGKKRFRFACHLVYNLRSVLGSSLPIQIAYAGDDDLPKGYRDYLLSLGTNIETFDVTKIFDDATLRLPTGGWAIKAFAILGSTFEQVMHLDADAVFLQRPETIFETHPAYHDTGVLLFHDRLLWQGAFKERHEWWEKELAHTELSDTIKHSKVYIDKYAEECDSGLVVVNKSKLGVLIGLLHIGWQNTYSVREAYTYRQGHGDKESWWFGFELVGTPYSFEEHYGSMLGHQRNNENRVCSFTIAHLDHRKKLLWYNGSLLKDKEISGSDFDIPTDWMVDGIWEKGATKADLSCMRGSQINRVGSNELSVLQKLVEGARRIDDELRRNLPDSMPSS
jgi:alpha 1,3-mannosyltransferase